MKNSLIHISYINTIFNALNLRYFEGKLANCIIKLTDKSKAERVSVYKVDGAGDYYWEIIIDESLLFNPIEEFVAELLHGMVHVWNRDIENIKDSSRGDSYHNKKFKKAAEKVDLDVFYDPATGWSIVKPTDELFEFILLQDWTEIIDNRKTIDSTVGVSKEHKSRGTSTRKYYCPKCGRSIRCTRDFTKMLLCASCNEYYIEETKEEKKKRKEIAVEKAKEREQKRKQKTVRITSIGEQIIYDFLTKEGYCFEMQKQYPKALDNLRFDFYCKKCLIEFDGSQHFSPSKQFGGISQFVEQVKNDNLKNAFCKEKNIPLLRIPYVYDPVKDRKTIEEIISEFLINKTVPDEIISFYRKQGSSYADLFV